VWPGTADAGTVARGIADPLIISSMTADQQKEALHVIGSHLRATHVRFVVSWASAQPDGPGVFDPTYMARVTSAVSLARGEGLDVIITFQEVPKWASDPQFWTDDKYKRNYAMSSAVGLPAFQSFCGDFATQFKGEVFAYECWNEPNLPSYLFPQVTKQDQYFGVHLYVKMLRRCSAGIRAVEPPPPDGAYVVAGATAPYGSPISPSHPTPPQSFAAEIKKITGVSALFDAYSHHPYTPGASRHLEPEIGPRDTKTTVNLGNLATLLKVFPGKDFYLTEYGYQTAACASFSGQYVDRVTQARYLTRAYAFAARFPQVKLLMWFLLSDYKPADPYKGFYTGLRSSLGNAKPAWYAFARGNHLTLIAPPSITPGSTLTLRGQLKCDSVGGVAGKALVVERRLAGGLWSTVRTVSSGAATVDAEAGFYRAQVKPKASASYRVRWLGVVTSPTRYVVVR